MCFEYWTLGGGGGGRGEVRSSCIRFPRSPLIEALIFLTTLLLFLGLVIAGVVSEEGAFVEVTLE